MKQQQGHCYRQGVQKDLAQIPKAAAQAAGKRHESEQSHNDAVQGRKDIREGDAEANADQDEPGKVFAHKGVDSIELFQKNSSISVKRMKRADL